MSKNPRAKMSKFNKANPRASRGKTPNSKPAGAKRHVMSLKERQDRLEARRALRLKEQKKVLREQAKQATIAAETEKLRVEGLLDNVKFSDFISKNVGKKAINVIKLLNSPQTDDKIAAELGVKINEVRRILNVLDSYGVARYDTNKDSKGWLTFKWYLDGEKLTELHESAITAKADNGYKLPENCNDFFYCGRCYEEAKVILPFDAAYEATFKCDGCGKALKQLSKEEARALFDEEAAQSAGAVSASV